jgi:hypothetical protein
MTTADVVRERVLALARSEVEQDEAVREIEALCEGRRVAVVRARQELVAAQEDAPDAVTERAIASLDQLLQRLPA